ncbi:MAG TPA: UxaA family hydrolase, partial [Methylomirabilota bacterium]|nr:UxaA family hydrolase [Methylomirabilota bacterium]
MATVRFEDFALLLREGDHVAVARRAIPRGTALEGPGGRIDLLADIPQGHKFALTTVEDGQPLRKYGQVIGFARGRIVPGEHVHTHNVAVREFGRDYAF